jgi:hypothetical protein
MRPASVEAFITREIVDFEAAELLRSDSLRTSAATTEKPRPASPARAASTAAFSARRSFGGRCRTTPIRSAISASR